MSKRLLALAPMLRSRGWPRQGAPGRGVCRSSPSGSSPRGRGASDEVDAPAAPEGAPTSSALRLIFDPVGRGKTRRRAVERGASDFMMSSHVAFLPAVALSAHAGLYELTRAAKGCEILTFEGPVSSVSVATQFHS